AVAHSGEGAGAPSRARRLRQLEECAPQRMEIGPASGVAEDDAQKRARPGEEEMRCQPRPLVNVLPAEQHVVLLEHGLYPFLAEHFAYRAPVLVVDRAARLVQHLPAALPGKIAEVRIFQIERMEQRIEAAQLEKLPAVEGAGPAAAIETGEEIVDGGVDAMPHAQAAVLPPALGQTGLLANFVRVGEENLAGDREDQGIAEAFEQWSEKAGVHAHVAVEQHHDFVPGGANTRIGTTAEAQ